MFSSPVHSYDISGTVSGNLENATIAVTTLAGVAVADTTTAADGTYTVTGVSSGSYYVTPSKANYIFSPFWARITVGSANVTALNFSSAAIDADVTADISVLPATTVEVGEAVLFSATGTTFASDATMGCTAGNNCADKTEYRWNFGDGYATQKGSGLSGQPHYSEDVKGIAVVHYFMTPGTYTVRMNAFVFNAWGVGNGIGTYPAIAAGTDTVEITVTGTAPVAGFEVQHANFNNRTKQYLYIKVPIAYSTTDYDLKLSLIGTTTGTSVLLTDNDPDTEVTYLFDQTGLAADTYVVQAQILNHSDATQVTGGIWRDKFVRTNTSPVVTIDENNSFYVNGTAFFPIAAFELSIPDYSVYSAGAGINVAHTSAYFSSYSPTSWQTNLSAIASAGLKAIGPGRYYYDSYAINYYNGSNYWEYNHDVDEMVEYVSTNKSSPAMFAWTWQDEPNLGGAGTAAYQPVIAAWSYRTHAEDTDHITYSLLGGYDWSPYASYSTNYRQYDYLGDVNTTATITYGSSWYLGGKKWLEDAIGFDIYPYSYRRHGNLNKSTAGPISIYLSALDLFYTNSKNLVPVVPTLQPCAEYYLSPEWLTPSDEQNYALAWLNVIHGAKGILWFALFDMSHTGRWDSMLKFANKMHGTGGWRDVVLGPVPAKTITRTDKANAALDRVDTMIREKDGVVYVIAARVTEPSPVSGYTYSNTLAVTSGHAGTGYKAGDILGINGGTDTAYITVRTVDGSGGVLTFSTAANGFAVGEGYSVSTGNATTGGSGSGCQMDVTSVIDLLYTGVEPETLSGVQFTISGLEAAGEQTLVKTDEDGNQSNITITNGVFTDTFGKYAVHFYTLGQPEEDIVAPTISSVTIGANGTTWTFAYDEPVTCASTANCCDDFTAVMTTAGAITLSYSSGSGSSSVICTGTPLVKSGDTIANGGVDYTTVENGIVDANSNDLASFTNKAVANNSTQVDAPTPNTTIGSGGTATLGSGGTITLCN